MSKLNLTQRQLCEKISQAMEHNHDKVVGFQGLLLLLQDYEDGDVTKQDLLDFGIINDNGSINSCAWTSDPILNQNFLNSKSMYIHHENDVYHNAQEFTNISDAFGGATFADYCDVPLMNYVQQQGFSTLLQLAKSVFDYGTTVIETDIVCYIGTQRILLCHMIIEGDKVTISNIAADFSEVMSSLSVVVSGTSMIASICKALSDGLSNPSDLYALMNNYVSSRSSSISSFATNIIKQGRNSTQSAIANIINMFRATFGDYSEDEEGNIKWTVTSQQVGTNFWAVAGNILIGGAQVLGTMLMYAGTIIVKVVGAVLFIGASILQAITTTIGSLTGTNPVVNDDSIDPCYHDPLAQCDGQDISDFTLHDDLLTQLRIYGRCKIVNPTFTLYLYNYKEDEDGNPSTVDWKCFVNMMCPCPSLWLSLNTYKGWSPTGAWKYTTNEAFTSGWVNYYISNALFPDSYSYWSFSLTGNNGFQYRLTDQARLYKVTVPLNFNDWILQSMSNSNESSGVNIKTNSADAANWKSFWDILKQNTIQALSYVFCNPLFYKDETGNQVSVVDKTHNHGYNLTNLFNYGYGAGIDYTKVINTIIDLGNINHNDDHFFRCLLNSSGLEKSTISNKRIYDSILTISKSNDHMNYSVNYYQIHFSREASDSLYYDDYIGVFPFLSIDEHAYATPPTTDFKSVIFGAVIATLLVAAVIVGVKVGSVVVKRKVQMKMERLGKKLLDEGETFRAGFTAEEFKELTPSDRSIYVKAYKKYQLKVKLYNFTANCLKLSSIDWINNWWNGYDSGAGAVITGLNTEVNADSISATGDVIDSVGSLYKYIEDPEYYNENPTDSLLIYRLISGRNPNLD